jgi:glycosyltransferase involved in cell wall biosynthesis
MTPVRIEFVIDHLRVGGAQRHLIELFDQLDRRRFAPQVSVAKPGGPLTPVIERLGIPVRTFGLGASLGRPRTATRLVHTARRLRAEHVDIVHGYLYLGNILGVLSGSLAGVPIRLASKRSLDHYARRTQLGATRLANRLADRIVCNAEAVRRCVLEEERPRPEKLVVIPNGIRLGETATSVVPVAITGAPSARRLVGTIGRLSWKKAYGDLLRAAQQVCAECRNVDFVIVGDGPLRPEVERQIAELGLAGRVRLLGEIADARRLLESFDVFVLSSMIEGMPNVLLEAMAAERPVVVTRAGGMPEIVTDERTGLLVPIADPGALARAILRVLRDPAEARRLGRAGRAVVEERYSAEAMGRRYAELYESLLRERALGPTPLRATADAPPVRRAVAGR